MAEYKGIESAVSHSEPSKEKENDSVIHRDKSPKHHKETHGTSDDIDEKTPIEEVKGPNVFQRVKEEIEAAVESPKHHKETHGTSDDIDEKTPIEEVKGPNVFQRVKEEIEAVVESVLPKK